MVMLPTLTLLMHNTLVYTRVSDAMVSNIFKVISIFKPIIKLQHVSHISCLVNSKYKYSSHSMLKYNGSASPTTTEL
jgi:hypothetical protein